MLPLHNVNPSGNSDAAVFLRALLRSKATLVCAGLAVTVTAFYLEQNWAGKRAWEKCKHELEAKGEVLDWNAYVPKAVPDDQNIFKAPKMSAWLVRGGSATFSSRLSPHFSAGQQALARPLPVAELTLVFTNSTPPDQADLVLQYSAPNLNVVSNDASASPSAPLSPPVIPLIVMDDAPLSDAIRNLARVADIHYTLDQNLLFDAAGNQHLISLRWENVTARQALKALLDNYGLLLVTGPSNFAARIIAKDYLKPRVSIDAATREAIKTTLSRSWGSLASQTNGARLNGSQGFTLLAKQPAEVRPVHIRVQTDEMPDKEELAAFFPPNSLSPVFGSPGPFQVKQTDSNTFCASVSPSWYSAADYLDWSDQFEPDFDPIREALKRPYSRMDGDYGNPSEMPIPNFVALRMLAQTLSQRAQCCLLLGEPEQALRELTLVHDLSRFLEARPSSHALTLVAAMINVAISGVYVEVISDGLRLHTWREPELSALQAQLQEVNLPPQVLQAFRCERAALCRTLETKPPTELSSLVYGKPNPGLWQKVKNPAFWVLSQMPRGWLYENMTAIAEAHQKLLNAFDPKLRVIRPLEFDQSCRKIEKAFSHLSPLTFIAAKIVPNYSRAWQATAQNQTRAHQALLACALERYRLAHGTFPSNLAGLVPDFLQSVPQDLVNGQPLHYILKDKNRFLLYSVGWNEADDGGLAARTKTGSIDPGKGDWVWQPDEVGS